MADISTIAPLPAGTASYAQPVLPPGAPPSVRPFARPYARLFAAALVITLLSGFLAASGSASEAAVMAAGPELTRLLRAMAVLKLTLVAGAAWLAYLRLRMDATVARACAYGAAGMAMAAGPGLIWGMAYVGTGALLLHGGLAALVLVAVTDRAVGPALSTVIARRRAALAARPPISD